MIRIISLSQAKNKLMENEVLVFKPLDAPITYLSLKTLDRISLFNENVRYNISFEQLENIILTNKVYVYEKDNQIEINQEFKKLIQ